jgi:DNA-directed RNA polymerase specialized sigma24 family protein
MRYRPAELTSQFKRFKDGNSDELDEILSSECPRLFDFLMRMTGQLSRSSETATESCEAMKGVAFESEDLQEFLISLYKTARKFSVDIWNADTSRLENSAYPVAPGLKPEKTVALLQSLESIVRSLPAKQREILLLHERFGFSPDEIAEITSYGLGDVEEIFAQALGVVESALPGDAEKVPSLFTKLYLFPMPSTEDVTTQNLSMVFKDLKKSSKTTSGGYWKFIVGIGLIVGSSWCALHFETVLEWLRPCIQWFHNQFS